MKPTLESLKPKSILFPAGVRWPGLSAEPHTPGASLRAAFRRRWSWLPGVVTAAVCCWGALAVRAGAISLTVQLAPGEAVSAGAAWRLLGEATWRSSGVTYTEIPAGTYFLEFKEVAGWSAPVREQPLVLADSTTHILASTYTVVPRYPVEVSATEGGFVEFEAWAPQIFGGLRPPGAAHTDAGRNAEWERALRNGPRTKAMPWDNAGWRVRLRALAAPGYEFAGWTGDATGTRNPLSFLAQGPRRIQAHFARPHVAVTATLRADYCDAPGQGTIHGQFVFPAGSRLELLRCRPELPPGWEMVSVEGLGGPLIEGTEVVFAGLAGHNPVQFNLRVNVLSEDSGLRTLGGEVEYRLAGEAASSRRPIGSSDVPVGPTAGARLTLAVAGGSPVLTVNGVVGRTYTLEQTPGWMPGGNQLWAFMGDLTLTNTTQTFVDPFPWVPGSSLFYRATVLE